jgi:hypothetical protein
MEGKWGEYFVFLFLLLALVLIIVRGENFSTFVKKSNRERWVIEDFGFVRAIERWYPFLFFFLKGTPPVLCFAWLVFGFHPLFLDSVSTFSPRGGNIIT